MQCLATCRLYLRVLYQLCLQVLYQLYCNTRAFGKTDLINCLPHGGQPTVKAGLQLHSKWRHPGQSASHKSKTQAEQALPQDTLPATHDAFVPTHTP